MPKTKELSIEMRATIIAYHNNGKSNRQISQELKVPRRTVDYNVKKFKTSESVRNKTRSGRPRATTSAEDRKIVISSKRNRRLTAPEIAAEVNVERFKPLSVSTVKRRLQEADLHGRVAVRKPLLRAVNKKKRLEWATQHKNWTLEEWKKVLWSDESKFEVFGSRRRVFVRRSAGERTLDQCLVPTVKHGGGSVMVWGCFGGDNIGNICRIQGVMRKEQYRDILENEMLSSGLRIFRGKFTFQHDNDPKHTSKLCKEYLDKLSAEGMLNVMVWPPQSPDLNPIELLWDELDRNVRKICPTSSKHLWDIIQSEWNKISGETLSKLLNRMPKLCEAVIKNKGGYIDESKI